MNWINHWRRRQRINAYNRIAPVIAPGVEGTLGRATEMTTRPYDDPGPECNLCHDTGDVRNQAMPGPEGAGSAVANGGDARVASAGSPSGVTDGDTPGWVGSPLDRDLEAIETALTWVPLDRRPRDAVERVRASLISAHTTNVPGKEGGTP